MSNEHLDINIKTTRNDRIKHIGVNTLCGISTAMCTMHWDMLADADWPLRYPWLFRSIWELITDVTVLNFAFGLSLFLVLRAVFTPLVSMLLGSAAAITLAIASEQKMRYLDMPVLPWDLWFLGNIGGFKDFLDLGSSGLMFLTAGIAISGLFLTWRYRSYMFRTRNHVFGILTALVICALWATWVVIPTTPKHLSGQIHNITWDQGANHANYGPFYTFLVNLRFIAIPAPTAAASVEAEKVNLLNEAPLQSDTTKPNVIVILSESFTTLPLAIFDRPFTCLKNAPLSKMITPAWGGFTANVEFEVLSGYPNSLFPTGSVPYQMYLKRPLKHGLPEEFRKIGYETLAVHTYDRNFFMRPIAYEMLGFDRYKGLEDLSNSKNRGMYVDDEVIFDEILEALRTGDRPQFVHAVTMMAHLPYKRPGRYPVIDSLAKELPPALTEYSSSLVQYASMVFDHERMFCSFLAKLKAMPQRSIVLFYGDHYPSFGSLEVYKAIHRTISPGGPAFDLYSQYSKTPILMFDSKKGFVSLPPEIPAYNAGALLIRRTGLPIKSVWAMPHKQQNKVITTSLYVAMHQRSSTVGSEAPPDATQELETLKAHAYHALIR